MALAYFADSTVSSAGGLYIQDGLHGPRLADHHRLLRVRGAVHGRGASPATGWPSATAGSGSAGDPGRRSRRSASWVAAAAPGPLVALLGFGVVGLGISVMAPLCFSAAAG